MKLFTAVYAFRIAVSSLWSYRLRTCLTALGIVIGVGTVIGINGIIEGLNTSFQGQVSMLGTGTLYVSRRPWIILGDWWKYRRRPKLRAHDADFLRERLVLADHVVPFVHHRAKVEIGDAELTEVRIIGTTDEWPAMSGITAEHGRFLVPSDVDLSRQVVAIGADLARVAKKEGIELGGDIRIAGRRLKIVGEMPSRGSMFGRSQDDFLAMPLPLFERMFGKRRSVQIGVVVSPEDLGRGTDEVIGAMRVKRSLEPDQENNFTINQQQMFVEFYRKLTGALFATAIGLAFVTLLVGGVGIMNIMLVAVAERTQEIGIRKAIGARPGVILAQFIAESAMVSGVGGVLGSGFGMLIAKAVREFTPLPARVPIEAVVMGIGFGLLVGVAFGFLPAYRASRLLPVDALRSE